jgi:hypothetical protein
LAKRRNLNLHFALAGALLLAATAADARNDKLLLPVAPAVAGSQLGEFQLRFGAATTQGAQPLGSMQVHATAEPYVMTSTGPARDRRTDTEMCQEAFRKAASELRRRAVAMGGTAAAGVVSVYKNLEFDSADRFECHVGMTKAHVELKGQAVR